MHELDDLAAELEAHPVVVDDGRLDDELLELPRRHRAVAIAIERVEEAGAHAADTGPRVGRDVDLVAVDHAVRVAIDHVARHLRVAAVHVAQHVLVTDERRGVRECGAAGGMIEVAMAVDDVAHGAAGEARVELALQPRRERLVDRVAEDDSRGRHEEHRVPIAVASAIEIAFDLRDLARRGTRLREADGGEHGDQRGNDETEIFQAHADTC